MLPKLFAPATLRQKPQVVATIEQMILRADPRAVAAALLGMAERADSTPLLGEIRCPVLAIVGQDDALTPPAEMRAMAEAIPAAQLVESPEAGHLSPMEQPKMFNAALRQFLAELSEPRCVREWLGKSRPITEAGTSTGS
jgi:pimeloyl-ACP methyl ester carboxylesterase